jgi:integrase/recombinase XerD
MGLRDRALLELAYSSGARREELCRLDVQDLDLDRGTVRLEGKGGHERVVPLGRTAVAWLRRYLVCRGETHPALWLNSRRTRMGYFALASMLQGYVQAAGLDPRFSLHALRRACATHMLGRGASPAALQALLGHASLKTLDRYLRVAIPELKAAHARTPPGQ